MKDKTQFLTLLSDLLPEKRLQHSIRVAETAEKLALFWGEDPSKAYLAGLLHDGAKYLNPDTWLERGLPEPSFSRQLYQTYRPVWHAFVAPVLLKHAFGIRQADVLSAAKWHTTGKAAMAPLDQIIFIADYIEPNRPFKECPYIRDLAHKNLDQATYALSVASILTLIHTGSLIHKETLLCRDYYLKSLPKDCVLEVASSIVSIQNTQ